MPTDFPSAPAAPPSTLWSDAWRRFCQHRVALAGLVFLTLLALACVAGPWFCAHEYDDQNLALGATPPSADHWLGTDMLGRDQLVRLLVGGRVSLGVALLATAVALLIGVTYGMTAGFAGGRADRVMMRIVDVLYALPFTIFVILLMVFFGQHLWLLFLAIGAVEWLTMARVVRARTRELRHLAFVEAARALGRTGPELLWRHLLPNLLGLIIVYATLMVPAVILLESFISFLGLGVQAPLTSWGDLIKQGADQMEEYPWLLIYPSIFFATTLFALNFLGDGLRDALDPRAGREG